MELVYLWVEKYKNIHKQGFNFSPRFDCKFYDEYDKDGKLKDDCKLDIKPKEHIENFFGDNINVTAIIGENGSGKSSIVNLFESNFTHMKIIYKLGDKFYTNFDVKKEYKQKYNIEFLSYLEDFYDRNINNESLHCNDSEPNECKLLTIAKVLEFDGNSFKFLNKNFIFTMWNINFQTNLPSLNSGIKRLDEKYENWLSKTDNTYLNIFVFVAIQLIQYILAKIPLQDSKYWKPLNALANEFTKKNYLILVNSIDLERLNGIGNYNLILSTLQKYDESIKYIEQFLKKQEISGTNIKEFILSGIYITFYGFCKNNFNHEIINIEYLTEQDLKYSDLSSGEQQRVVNSALLIKKTMNENISSKHNLYIFDEPDMYLHPNWQKQLINDFITILKKYIGKSIDSIHLIITSHSPFVVSDLPKENIIFLDTDEQGNCKVVDGLSQTFGANIHTLLSDSFFMKDGLMGEFAKEKINDVYNFIVHHNTDKIKSKENAQAIIDIVGEPLIQRELQQLFDKKFELTNMSIDDEISLLERKLEALKEIKNDTN